MSNRRSITRLNRRLRIASSHGGAANSVTPVVHWTSLREYFFTVKGYKDVKILWVLLQKSVLGEYRMQEIIFGFPPRTIALDNSALEVAMLTIEQLLKKYESIDFRNSQQPMPF